MEQGLPSQFNRHSFRVLSIHIPLSELQKSILLLFRAAFFFSLTLPFHPTVSLSGPFTARQGVSF
jgi:hypothetical protein